MIDWGDVLMVVGLGLILGGVLNTLKRDVLDVRKLPPEQRPPRKSPTNLMFMLFLSVLIFAVTAMRLMSGQIGAQGAGLHLAMNWAIALLSLAVAVFSLMGIVGGRRLGRGPRA